MEEAEAENFMEKRCSSIALPSSVYPYTFPFTEPWQWPWRKAWFSTIFLHE